jgi:DNA-binding MarR family transcriptional regulator
MGKLKQKKKPAPDTSKVADGLHSAAIHLLRRVRKQDAATGEGPARLSALSVLVFGGPMTLGQLAAAEQVRPPTMTRIVTGLEKTGLARRKPDPTDARRVRIFPTAKGVRLLQRGRQRRIEYLARHLERLDDQELRALRKAVQILERVLEQGEELTDR